MSLRSLRVYVRYRREKRQTDALMGRAVQICKVKGMFNRWQRHMGVRVGLKIIEKALFEARVR